MGRRGPKPAPASVKKAKGNPGRRPIGEEQSSLAAAEPTKKPAKVMAPAWLKGEALKLWNRLAPELADKKLLAQPFAETFARYCQSCTRWHEMRKRIDKEGLTVHIKSNHGEWDRLHPLLLASDRLEVRLQAFEDRFGLNPAERQRIFAARAAGGSSWPEDLFGNRDQQSPKPSSTPAAEEKPSPVGYLM